MVHQDGDNLQIKQVEFNTIASSFGGLSAQTSLLHKYDPTSLILLAQLLTKRPQVSLQN
jgi:glutathione synthase